MKVIEADTNKMIATEQAYLDAAKEAHKKASESFITAGVAKDLEPIINWMQLVNNHLVVLTQRLEEANNAN